MYMFMCAHVVRSVSNLNELVQKWDHRKKEKYMKVFSYGSLFLAPTGAQEVTMLVRPFVPNLSQASNLHHLGSDSS